MTLSRFIAFSAALVITLFLASVPALMVEAAARHRQATLAERHSAADRGVVRSSRDSRGVHQNPGGDL
jgi:hypothetical protein